MADWSSIADHYGDAVKAALPLQRLALAGLGFLGSLCVDAQKYLSITETLVRVQLSDLSFAAGALLAKAAVGHIVLGLALASLGWLASRAILAALYAVGSRAIRLAEQQAPAMAQYRSLTVSREESAAAIAQLDSIVQGPARRMRALNAAAELAAGVALGAGIAAIWGNALDVLVSLASLLAALALHSVGLRIFLRSYLGPAMVKAAILGLRAPDPSDIRDPAG